MTKDKRPIPPVPRALTLFVIAFMSITTFMAINQGNHEFLFYGFTLLIIIYILVELHRRVTFTRTALWLLTIWGFLHMIGGTVPVSPEFVPDEGSAVLYSFRLRPDLPRYDQIIHAFGFFSATVACWEAVRVLLGARRSVTLSIIAAIMGMGLGALNEVIEFIATRITDTNVGGYTNTGWDLVSNTIGTICAGFWCLNRNLDRTPTSDNQTTPESP
jgi:putative membrane protein